MDVNEILADRQKTHGDFVTHAQCTQDLKEVFSRYCREPRKRLTASQREALSMIAHKIGRILAGNPDHKDHWDDIAGYATLISKELK